MSVAQLLLGIPGDSLSGNDAACAATDAVPGQTPRILVTRGSHGTGGGSDPPRRIAALSGLDQADLTSCASSFFLDSRRPQTLANMPNPVVFMDCSIGGAAPQRIEFEVRHPLRGRQRLAVIARPRERPGRACGASPARLVSRCLAGAQRVRAGSAGSRGYLRER